MGGRGKAGHAGARGALHPDLASMLLENDGITGVWGQGVF